MAMSLAPCLPRPLKVKNHVLGVLFFMLATGVAFDHYCTPEQSKCHNYQCCEPDEFCGLNSYECEPCFPVGNTAEENLQLCLSIENVTDISSKLRHSSCGTACLHRSGVSLYHSHCKESSDMYTPLLVGVIVLGVLFVIFLGIAIVLSVMLLKMRARRQSQRNLSSKGEVSNDVEGGTGQESGSLDRKKTKVLSQMKDTDVDTVNSTDSKEIKNDGGHKSNGNDGTYEYNEYETDDRMAEDTRLLETSYRQRSAEKGSPNGENPLVPNQMELDQSQPGLNQPHESQQGASIQGNRGQKTAPQPDTDIPKPGIQATNGENYNPINTETCQYNKAERLCCSGDSLGRGHTESEGVGTGESEISQSLHDSIRQRQTGPSDHGHRDLDGPTRGLEEVQTNLDSSFDVKLGGGSQSDGSRPSL